MHRPNIIYGMHSAEEVIRNQPSNVNQIWVSSAYRNSRLKRLVEEARIHKIPVKTVDKNALIRIAGNTHHQDIVLEISPYRYFDADQLLENANENSLFCILDEIQDSTNLATLVRTMDGARVQGIFLSERRSAAVTPTTHRLSAGALQHVKIARVGNLTNLLVKMQALGMRIICADASATKLWYEADYSGPLAILVGNEHKGVRRLLKEKSDECVRIPMLGKLQSLNVNVAAAILLYEAIRQRTTS